MNLPLTYFVYAGTRNPNPFMIARSNGTFSKGNGDEYSAANATKADGSPLEGKTILFLGSSVTYGSAAKGESFADYLAARDGVIVVKEAVSGTLLVDQPVYGKQSYTRIHRRST